MTNTGTARVYFHDRNGTFAAEDFIGLQIMLQLYDPVDVDVGARVPRPHRRHRTTRPSPGAPTLTNVQIDCVDIFDYLGGVQDGGR